MFTNLPYFRRDDWFDGFDKLFKGWLDDTVMRTDVQEKDNNFVLDIELPGFEKENIAISLDDGNLVVTAQMSEVNEEDKKGRYLRRERRSGSFTRSYFVGDIEEDEIKASFKNGVLEITFPKESAKKIESKKTIAIE